MDNLFDIISDTNSNDSKLTISDIEKELPALRKRDVEIRFRTRV